MGEAATHPRSGTLVIGVGNSLMGDDGLGIAAVEHFRDGWVVPDDVALVDGGTWGLNLLPLVEQAEHVIFVDAIRRDEEPGTLTLLEGADLPSYLSMKLSPHEVDLRDVLALAELRGTLPSDICVIGLEPAAVHLSTRLSPLLECMLPRLYTAIAAQLETWGHRCCRRDEARRA